MGNKRKFFCINTKQNITERNKRDLTQQQKKSSNSFYPIFIRFIQCELFFSVCRDALIKLNNKKKNCIRGYSNGSG